MVREMDTAARRFLEMVTRWIVIRRRLPSEFGSRKIWVSPSAGLKYLFKPMARVDEGLLALAAELVKPGNIVWDVGANVGLFSFASASKAGPQGKVIACEPDTWLVQLLRHSASDMRGGHAEMTVIPVALAGSVGLAKFHVSNRSRARSSLAGYGYAAEGQTFDIQVVPTVSLDWLLQRSPAPDILKIDVEGAETEILQGADVLLTTKRPIIICEVGPDSQKQVTEILKAHSYLLYDCDDISRPRRVVETAPWNTLAIPSGIVAGSKSAEPTAALR
jgi:FkbM family methyltransferase